MSGSRSNPGPGLSFLGSHGQQPPATFSRLPPELLRSIADQTAPPEQRERACLCRVNKFFNAACTPSLYGGRISIGRERLLDSFSNTILLYRPELAMLVKDLCIDADTGGWDKNDWYTEINSAVLVRAAKTLAACVNIHTLSIIAFCYEEFSDFCAFFDPLPIIPGLRHLRMQFSLDVKVLEFVKHHHSQLRSLSIIHVHDDGDDALATGTLLCSQFSLPLSISRIECSPFLAPIFVPNSPITDVALDWPQWDVVEDVAPRVVTALARSTTPVVTLSYDSKSWNIEFIRLAASNLHHLERLSIVNEHVLFPDEDDISPDTLIAPVLNVLQEKLSSFKYLKVLRLHWDHYTKATQRTYYDDYKLVQTWAALCPTLVYCFLPGTDSAWIRHPSYGFFVPDTILSEDRGGPPKYTREWLHELFEKEGPDFAATWFRQYADIKKDGIADIVSALDERAVDS